MLQTHLTSWHSERFESKYLTVGDWHCSTLTSLSERKVNSTLDSPFPSTVAITWSVMISVSTISWGSVLVCVCVVEQPCIHCVYEIYAASLTCLIQILQHLRTRLLQWLWYNCSLKLLAVLIEIVGIDARIYHCIHSLVHREPLHLHLLMEGICNTHTMCWSVLWMLTSIEHMPISTSTLTLHIHFCMEISL